MSDLNAQWLLSQPILRAPDVIIRRRSSVALPPDTDAADPVAYTNRSLVQQGVPASAAGPSSGDTDDGWEEVPTLPDGTPIVDTMPTGYTPQRQSASNGWEEVPENEVPPEYRHPQSAGRADDGGWEEVPLDELPPGVKPQDVAAPAWKDVPRLAASNAPDSAIRFVGGMADAVTHPANSEAAVIEAASPIIGSAAATGMAQANPIATGVLDLISKVPAAAKFYRQRYGSVDNLKRTLASDPVGALADASAVLSGGEGLAARLTGDASLAARTLGTAAKLTNPVTLPAAVLKYGAIPAAGGVARIASGVPFSDQAQILRAARNGDRTAVEAMRGTAAETPADMARGAVGSMYAERGQSFDASKPQWEGNPTPLSYQPVHDALAAAQQKVMTPAGFPRDLAAQQALTDMAKATLESAQATAGAGTASELQALKQRLGAIRAGTPEGSLARNVADQVYHAARDNISDNIPGYGDAMRDYQAASGRIQNTTKQLGLNTGALDSTIESRLLGRSPAARSAAQTLMQYDPRLRAALAGRAAASWVPRGLVRRMTEGGAAGVAGVMHGAALLHPAGLLGALAAAGISSPRIVGEAANLLGNVQRYAPAERLRDLGLLGRLEPDQQDDANAP